MKIAEFERIGLKEKEAKVYMALLEEGSSLANHIAKKTNILRSSIYDYFDVLLEKGFISYTIKSGKKYFQATSPEKIIDLFEERKQKESDALKEIVPQLAKLQNISEKKAKVEVFEGKEGMKTAMSYILKDKPEEIKIYGTSGASHKVLPFFMEHWHNERIKKKIPFRIIYNDVSESKERIEKGPSLKLARVRFIPIKDVSITGTVIYNNKILITIWNEKTPLAIQIEGEEISKSYKDNFEVLWKIAESYKK